MKRFSWPMQRLLDLTLQKEEAIRAELIRLASDLAALRHQMRQKRQAIRQRLTDLAAQSLERRLGRQEMFVRWSAAQEKEIAALRERAGVVETRRKQMLQKYAQMRSYRQMLERLRVQSLDRYRKERLRWEQKHLDEAARISHIRKTDKGSFVESQEVLQ